MINLSGFFDRVYRIISNKDDFTMSFHQILEMTHRHYLLNFFVTTQPSWVVV